MARREDSTSLEQFLEREFSDQQIDKASLLESAAGSPRLAECQMSQDCGSNHICAGGICVPADQVRREIQSQFGGSRTAQQSSLPRGHQVQRLSADPVARQAVAVVTNQRVAAATLTTPTARAAAVAAVDSEVEAQMYLTAVTETATRVLSTVATAGHGSASHALPQEKIATISATTATSCLGKGVRAVKTGKTANLWIAGSVFRVA